MRKATGNHLINTNSLVHMAIQTKKSLDANDLSSDRELTIYHYGHVTSTIPCVKTETHSTKTCASPCFLSDLPDIHVHLITSWHTWTPNYQFNPNVHNYIATNVICHRHWHSTKTHILLHKDIIYKKRPQIRDVLLLVRQKTTLWICYVKRN